MTVAPYGLMAEDDADDEEPLLPVAANYQDLLRSLGGGHALKKLREASLLAENADAETRIFERYDHDSSGDIDKEELRDALEEIGLLDFDSASADAVGKAVAERLYTDHAADAVGILFQDQTLRGGLEQDLAPRLLEATLEPSDQFWAEKARPLGDRLDTAPLLDSAGPLGMIIGVVAHDR